MDRDRKRLFQFSNEGRHLESNQSNDVRSWMLKDIGANKPSPEDVPSWLTTAGGAVLKQTEVLCARCDFKDEPRDKKGLLDSRPAHTGKYDSKFNYVPSYPPASVIPQKQKVSHSLVPPLQQSTHPNYLVFSEYQNISSQSEKSEDGPTKPPGMSDRSYLQNHGQRGIPVRSKQYDPSLFADETVSVSSDTVSDFRNSATRSNRDSLQSYGRANPSFELIAEVVELTSGKETVSVLTTV